jgi:hypothetical protein
MLVGLGLIDNPSIRRRRSGMIGQVKDTRRGHAGSASGAGPDETPPGHASPGQPPSLPPAAARVVVAIGGTGALEAAVRRDQARGTAAARLAAFERVVRAQQMDQPWHFAHFSLLGLVTAGRDETGTDSSESPSLSTYG